MHHLTRKEQGLEIVILLLVLGLPVFREHPKVFYIHWCFILALLLFHVDWTGLFRRQPK